MHRETRAILVNERLTQTSSVTESERQAAAADLCMPLSGYVGVNDVREENAGAW